MNKVSAQLNRVQIQKIHIKLILINNQTRMKSLTIFLTLIQLLVGKLIYDFKKSYVINLTPNNYVDQISKYRQNTNYVSIVQFYKYSDSKSLQFVPKMDNWTTYYRGVFRIGAIDCDQYQKFCLKQQVTTYPTFKIIPPVPIPIITFNEQLTVQNLQKVAGKYLHSNIIQITSANINTFIGQNPSVPKVFFFTDKPKGISIIYKGLSVAFQKKLNFGLIRKNDQILVNKYGIQVFPSVMVLKTGQKKPFYFDNKKQSNFENIFQFLNIYSEAFVPGGGSTLESSATKQWMTQIFPQLYDKSAKDVCIGADSTLCVILLTNQKPSKQLTAVFQALNTKFDRKIDRGAKYKFMWLNAKIQKNWGQFFKYKGQNKVVILNPGKRRRYTEHEGEINKESITMTLDSVSGGDARFNRIAELPNFEIRSE